MSSASLIEKRSMKKFRSHNIETSSTSAPPTSDSTKQGHNDRHLKEKMVRSKERDSLPDISARKGNRIVRASNFELSSSANDFARSITHQKTVPHNVIKSKGTTPTVRKNEAHESDDDKIYQMIKTDLMAQQQNTNSAESEYNDLKMHLKQLQEQIEKEQQHPTSEYDESISKQSYFNETLKSQISDAKEKLKTLSQSLKTLRSCQKDCNIHMRDLIIDYNCITKGELSKEIKRFQRMEIDLKNALDRLHWRMDCESKMYHNLIDQYHKLQMDLYYLKNVNESS